MANDDSVPPRHQTDHNCRAKDLEPGTYHVAGHEYVVVRKGKRRAYFADGLRVDRDVFVALFETARILERLAANDA